MSYFDIIRKLTSAARPFTSGDIVDKTGGTIPLMDKLGEAIEEAERFVETKENK